MKRGQTIRHTDTQTLRLLDQISPVGRFDENQKLKFGKSSKPQIVTKLNLQKKSV